MKADEATKARALWKNHEHAEPWELNSHLLESALHLDRSDSRGVHVCVKKNKVHSLWDVVILQFEHGTLRIHLLEESRQIAMAVIRDL